MSAAVDYGQLLAAYENDFEFYCKHNIKIATKSGDVVPFEWNEEQKYLNERAQAQLSTQGYIRLLILKGRQWGGSTWVEARGYSICSRRPNHTGFVMAHQIPASNNLFGMAKLMLANDVAYEPKTQKSNAKELVFEVPENSRLVVQTAPKQKGAGVGRSFTPRFLHCSEAAWWGEMGAHNMGGLMQAVPKEHPAILGTEVYWETTAHGYDPVFYAKWEEVNEAREKGHPTEWEQVFIPWFWHKAYSHELSEEQRDYILKGLTDEERWLLRQKRLDGTYVTPGQLSWRRQTIADGVPPPGLTKSQFFKQEYPATPTEAFQATGSHIFDLDQVHRLLADAQPAPARYEFLLESGEVVARHDGRFHVWEEPDPMRSYVVGADVAEGLEHGDWSCVKVADHHTGEEVALWHGDIHPSDLGKLTAAIGKRYNNAWLGVERNNHGLTTITKLQELEYPRLYVEYAVDTPGAKPRKRYGWMTTTKTKPMMVDTLTLLVAQEPESIRDKETFREMLYFEKHEDGKYGAQEGKNDDRLMASAIARELRKRLPTPTQQAAKMQENRRKPNPPPAPARNTGTAQQRWKGFTK